MKRLFVMLTVVSMVSLAASVASYAQGFGKNKVQYKNFDWKVVRTENFDIYFYQGEEDLVKFAAQTIEDAYQTLKSDLGHTVKWRMPIVIYNSHNDFEQTNVILELIEESVGGFTELYKNRVVVPYDGSYERFRHVLMHELTHVFEFDIVYGGSVGSILTRPLYAMEVPLWVFEGLSEFESIGWDEDSDMYMRDIAINQNITSIPELAYTGGYVVYKEGQSIYNFIAEKYGRKEIGELLHRIRVSGGLDAAVKSSLGISLEQLDKDWKSDLKRKYWPLMSDRQEMGDIAREMTDHSREGGVFNTGPALSPDGDKVAFLSDRSGRTDLYVASAIDGKILKHLIKGESSSGFESMHTGRAKVSFSPDGKRIAFAAKAGSKDRLYIVNASSGRVEKKLRFDLDGVFTPAFSPDGKRVAIAGLQNGFSDIYVVNLDERSLKRLTNDLYDDRDPSWSQDGKTIAFASDRPDTVDTLWTYGRYAVFFASDEGESVRRVTERSGFVASPVIARSDSSLFYISDLSGAKNLYYRPSPESASVRLTNVLGGVFSISASDSADKIIFSGYRNSGWDLFLLKDPLELKAQSSDTSGKFSARSEEFNTVEPLPEKEKVGLVFTPDWASGGFSYTSEYGFSGQTEIAVSDILGNHRIYFVSDLFGDVFTSNFYLEYWYMPRRVDFGGAIFQQKDYYVVGSGSLVEILTERTFGASVLASYPFDMYNRVEFQLDGYAIEDRYDIYEETPSGYYGGVDSGKFPLVYVALPSIAYAHDTSVWGETGPLDGSRIRLSVGKTIPFSSTSPDYATAVADARKYLRMGERYCFAFRLVGASSSGPDAVTGTYWIGGSQTLRGYDDYEFYGTQVAFLNTELRYPFVDRLKLAFPIPLDFRSLRGALFLDMGGATDDWKTFRVSREDDGVFKLQDMKVGFGMGMRMNLSFLVFKIDAAKSTDLSDISKDTHWYFTLGSEF
jgi:hypothetical protein